MKNIKRIKVVNKKKFMRGVVFIVLAIIGIMFLLSKTTESHNDISQINYDIIVVDPGDTLWQISLYEQENNQYYINKDVRYIINEIKKINNLNTSDLQVGQKIKIPVI